MEGSQVGAKKKAAVKRLFFSSIFIIEAIALVLFREEHQRWLSYLQNLQQRLD